MGLISLMGLIGLIGPMGKQYDSYYFLARLQSKSRQAAVVRAYRLGCWLFVPDATDARQGEGVVWFVAVVVECALSSSPHGRRFG